MKWVYQWLGCEIYFVHVGHGLLGVGVWVILAFNLPLWLFAAIAPVIGFSLWGWTAEAKFVLPVARRYLSGDPFGGKATTATATTRPRGD